MNVLRVKKDHRDQSVLLVYKTKLLRLSFAIGDIARLRGSYYTVENVTPEPS